MFIPSRSRTRLMVTGIAALHACKPCIGGQHGDR